MSLCSLHKSHPAPAHSGCPTLSPIERVGSSWLRALRLVGIGFLLMGLTAGCAGYRLGPSSGMVAGEKTIQIHPLLNQTLQPRLTDVVTQQLRKAFQRDGTFRLATREDGDLALSGTLTRYERSELSLASGDALTVTDYRLSLTAQVKAVDRVSGKTLFEGPVQGVTLIRVGSDLASAERQALPLLAEDLARNITRLLADGAW